MWVQSCVPALTAQAGVAITTLLEGRAGSGAILTQPMVADAGRGNRYRASPEVHPKPGKSTREAGSKMAADKPPPAFTCLRLVPEINNF
jgi:hypothetical protein